MNILQQPFFFESTQRVGSFKLFYKAFDYTKAYTTKRIIKWVCAQKYLLQCKARITMQNNTGQIKINNGMHNHLSPPMSKISANYKMIPINKKNVKRILENKKK